MIDDETVNYFGSRQSLKGLILFACGAFALLAGVMALVFGVGETEFALPAYGVLVWAVVSIVLGVRARGSPLPPWLWWLSHLWLASILATFAYVQITGKING